MSQPLEAPASVSRRRRVAGRSSWKHLVRATPLEETPHLVAWEGPDVEGQNWETVRETETGGEPGHLRRTDPVRASLSLSPWTRLLMARKERRWKGKMVARPEVSA